MQNKKKVQRIRELLNGLQIANETYSDEKVCYYFDYETVIELLEQTQTVMEDSARCPRPADLPSDLPWCERLVTDPTEEFDPYAFDGSMSEEDYELMWEHIRADRCE